jgi:hypothetical protein
LCEFQALAKALDDARAECIQNEMKQKPKTGAERGCGGLAEVGKSLQKLQMI